MRGSGSIGERLVHDAFVLGAGALVVGVGAFALHEATGFDPFGDVHVKIEAPDRQPPVLNAGVVQVTVATQEVALFCPDEFTAGVETHGNQGIDFFDSSTETKEWFGQGLACGDGNELIASAKVASVNNVVEEVDATLPPIIPYDAGINFLDVRNVIHITPYMNQKQIHAAVVSYLTKKAKGHQPGPSFGYHNSGVFVTDSDSDLLPDTEQAAQLALQLNALPQAVINNDMPRIINEFKSLLAVKYGPQALIVIHGPTQPETTLQVIENRFAPIAIQAGQSFSSLLFKDGKGHNGKEVLQLAVKGGGGEGLTVDFTDGTVLSPAEITELNAYFQKAMYPTPELKPAAPQAPASQVALNK